jgi:hypothetical protein
VRGGALVVAVAALLALAVFAGPARADERPARPRALAEPDGSYTYAEPRVRPTLAWAALQLVPSPEVAFGFVRHTDIDGRVEDVTRVAPGLRWQLTPVLWSFGTHRRLSRWRFFVVDPLARVSGSLELHTTFEWIGGHIDALLVRPGVRATLPIAHRGEYLAVSFGTTTYRSETTRVAYDAGLWFLFGTVGIQATVAPVHSALSTIATLRLRYF